MPIVQGKAINVEETLASLVNSGQLSNATMKRWKAQWRDGTPIKAHKATAQVLMISMKGMVQQQRHNEEQKEAMKGFRNEGGQGSRGYRQ